MGSEPAQARGTRGSREDLITGRGVSVDSSEGAAQAGRPFRDPGAGEAPAGWDLIARAVADYHGGDVEAAVTLTSDVEDDRVLPAAHFFRGARDMPSAEREALGRARGRVLDVSEERAVIQVFEGTQGISLGGTAVRFLGKALEFSVSRELLGRILDMVKNVGETGNVVDNEELRHVVHYCREFNRSNLQPGGQPC